MKDKHLRQAHRRRAPLREAASDLELAISAPVGTGPKWQKRVRARLEKVGTALGKHIEDVEGPNGLFEELANAAPRLSNLVAMLDQEHEAIRADLANAVALVEALPLEIEDGEAGQAREAVLALLGRISRHRQKGADLVWRAFSVDIGGE